MTENVRTNEFSVPHLGGLQKFDGFIEWIVVLQVNVVLVVFLVTVLFILLFRTCTTTTAATTTTEFVTRRDNAPTVVP